MKGITLSVTKNPGAQPFNDDTWIAFQSRLNEKPVKGDPVRLSPPNPLKPQINDPSGSASTSETGNASAGRPGIPPQADPIPADHVISDFEISGYELAFTGLYGMIFNLAEMKTGLPLSLTKTENKELVEATIPLIRKYAGRDFKYGPEARFLFTIVGVTTKKIVKARGDEMDIPIIPDMKDADNQQDVIDGVQKMVSENSDLFGDLVPSPLNDMEFQKIKKILSLIPDPSLKEPTRDVAGKFKSMILKLGMTVETVEMAINSIGPDNVLNLIKAQIPK